MHASSAAPISSVRTLASARSTVAFVALITLSPSQPECAGLGHPDVPVKSANLLGTTARSAPFVSNLGQWRHAAQFVLRSGAMTVFLEDRGWVLDLDEPLTGASDEAPQKNRSAALAMTFEGSVARPKLIGEKRLAGHHNYLLGRAAERWRTGVPLFASVRYEELYPGIDVRLRHAAGVPEYDLLLEPGADLDEVVVRVAGGSSLRIDTVGSLIIETPLGPLTQPVPKTWEVDAAGTRREVVCAFEILGPDSFGFVAPEWDTRTHLTIDPGLVWSTYLGGSSWENANAVDVDARGFVTVAGVSGSSNYPTTVGAYDRSLAGTTSDVVVTKLDPRANGSAQLVYSTFLGGQLHDLPHALTVGADGVVTVAGETYSTDFPTTPGAFDRGHNGRGTDAFVCRLDPGKTGAAQLVYSSLLGRGEIESAWAVHVDAGGVITLAGETASAGFPTSPGAFDRSFNGGFTDVFVTRLDPGKPASSQLIYSTLLGGSGTGTEGYDSPRTLHIDSAGVLTLGGYTTSANFPTSNGAFDRGYSLADGFLSRLDPSKVGAAQLVFSTYVGGRYADSVHGVSVDAAGIVTAVGNSLAADFPTTAGAYSRTNSSPGFDDVFVTRFDPTKTGRAQLLYSSLFGGASEDTATAVHIDPDGVVTLVGDTTSSNFPTTPDAYDRTHRGGMLPEDVFVARIDPRRTGKAQLVYSSYLGGTRTDMSTAIAVDRSGVATIAGWTDSAQFPTTNRAFSSQRKGSSDGFLSRIDMGVRFFGDGHEIQIQTGGRQTLTVNAGRAHANRSYWVFGSNTGTSPGIRLNGVHIPLNPDLYTNLTIGLSNGSALPGFQGTLDALGRATAAIDVPANLAIPAGLTTHHAYVVYDPASTFHLASNAVPLHWK